MSETDEGLAAPATWSGMFSKPGREQRRVDERKGVKTRAQRDAEKKRPPQKTAQINFRATPEFKALCDLVARRLDEPVAEMFVIAVNKIAAEHGINISNPET
jgi:ribosomal protein S25